jgi:hypothetical protein
VLEEAGGKKIAFRPGFVFAAAKKVLILFSPLAYKEF